MPHEVEETMRIKRITDVAKNIVPAGFTKAKEGEFSLIQRSKKREGVTSASLHAMQVQRDKLKEEQAPDLVAHYPQRAKQLRGAFSSVFPLSSINGQNGVEFVGIDADDYAGFPAAGLGDVNGDDIDDAIICARRADPNSIDAAGECYVIFGLDTGTPSAPTGVSFPAKFYLSSLDGSNGFTINGVSSGDQTATEVTAADMNGDGIQDIVLGAPLNDPNGVSSGQVFVVFGQNTTEVGNFPNPLALSTIDGTNGFVMNGIAMSYQTGFSVARAGDVNNDGFDDLIIGAPTALSGDGECYVIYGRDTLVSGDFVSPFELSGVNGVNGFRLQGDIGDVGEAGNRVGGVGDINGDGICDFVIGEPRTASDAGRVHIIYGRDGDFPDTIPLLNLGMNNTGFTLNGNYAGDQLFTLQHNAVDINGDFISDLLIGAERADRIGEVDSGEAYVIFGRNTAIEGDFPALTTPSLAIGGGKGFVMRVLSMSAEVGNRVDGIGDFNGDGIEDIIVGAFGTFSLRGAAYVLYGRNTSVDGNFPDVIDLLSLSNSDGFAVLGKELGDSLGLSVRNLGDLNNDGATDFIVGARGAGENDAGRAYALFGQLNARPILGNNQLTISQGEALILNSTNLSATDVDDDDATLTFTVSNVREGQFEFVSNPGVPITSFTQQDITDSEVRFVHGSSTIPPSYDVSVSDGLVSTQSSSAGITFNLKPDLLNNRLSLNQGETVTLTTSDLSATDVDNADPSLVFMMSNVMQGQFEEVSNPSVAITSFTQQQNIDSEIQFVHDNMNVAPSYDVSVDDGSINTTPVQASIDFNARPMIVNNVLSLAGGETKTLSAIELSASDDNDPSLLTFTPSNVMHGLFQLFSNPGLPISNFLQQQITSSQIQFVHDGSQNPPSYTITVNDGALSTMPSTVNIADFNPQPELVTNELTITQGATVLFNSSMLNAMDDMTPAGALMFEVTEPMQGQFQICNPTCVSCMPPCTFTQQQVIDGNIVQFTHDDSQVAPSYKVSVIDDDPLIPARTTPVIPTMVNFNARPTLANNRLIINDGETKLILGGDMRATDVNDDDAGLTFTVSNVLRGQFELSTMPTVPITSFTQLAIFDRLVQFVHDGSNNSPSYELCVSDSTFNTPSMMADITFNARPILTNNSLALSEGIEALITSNELSATDVDDINNDEELLEFTVLDVERGQFQLNSEPGVEVTTFLQRDIISNDLIFVPDGSRVAPSFLTSVSDGVLSSTPQAAEIDFSVLTSDEPSSSSSGDNTAETIGLAVGVGGGVGLLAIAAAAGLAGYGFFRHRRKQNNVSDTEMMDLVNKNHAKKSGSLRVPVAAPQVDW